MNDAAAWDAFERELDAWGDRGETATFWWRDDDAVTATPALDTLLRMVRDHDVPLALAAIPAAVDGRLSERVAAEEDVTVLQHGYAHRNYAGRTGKKAELGGHRPAAQVVAELAAGREQLDTLFGDLAIPVVVPPWNRIAAHLVPMLPELRFRGLSAYGARPRPQPFPGLRQVNTHIDIIDWSGTRGFAGVSAVLALATAHLRARRGSQADASEPTGLLTHHLDHDPAAWRFAAAFADRLSAHSAACWTGARSLFMPAGAADS